MAKIIGGRDHGIRVTCGIEVRITELIWDDGGRSFEVHRDSDGEDFTQDGCFDTIPTDRELTALVTDRTTLWTCRGCGRQIEDSQADLVADHIQQCDRRWCR